MSQSSASLSRNASVRRPHSRQGRLTIAISVVAFFAAIGVVGWFGLTGLQAGDDQETGAPQIVFAGGTPRLAVVDDTAPATGEEAAAEDEHVIGDFGDPVDELYADDSRGGGGGWGEAALDNAPGFQSGSSDDGWERGRD